MTCPKKLRPVVAGGADFSAVIGGEGLQGAAKFLEAEADAAADAFGEGIFDRKRRACARMVSLNSRSRV